MLNFTVWAEIRLSREFLCSMVAWGGKRLGEDPTNFFLQKTEMCLESCWFPNASERRVSGQPRLGGCWQCPRLLAMALALPCWKERACCSFLAHAQGRRMASLREVPEVLAGEEAPPGSFCPGLAVHHTLMRTWS